MPLLTVVIILICVGVIVTLLKRYGGRAIDQPYLTWIVWLILVVTAIWLLSVIGVFDYFRAVPMPTLRK